jgi:hypothetical protein
MSEVLIVFLPFANHLRTDSNAHKVIKPCLKGMIFGGTPLILVIASEFPF